MNYCKNCQKKLSHDDIGAYKKFVNRGATEYLCISCLAKHFKCSENLILKKIEYFKSTGCSLFD